MLLRAAQCTPMLKLVTVSDSCVPCPRLPAAAETSKRARATIAELGERFVRSGDTVLCHGHSRVVLSILRKAAAAVSQ